MIQIKNNDCLKELKKISENHFTHCVTSPPYNRKRNDKYAHYDDIKHDWGDWLILCTREMMRVTKGNVFLNLQKNYYNKSEVFKLIGEFANQIQEIIIWEKSNPMPASGKSITNAVEYIIVLGDKPLKSNTTYTKNIITTSVNSNMPKSHKAVMKQEVSDHLIDRFTEEKDKIIDPFMGVGTTGISCIKMSRDFYGIEINAKYCKMAKDNINEQRNKKVQ